MTNNIEWIYGNIKRINKFKNNLFSIIFNANIDKFIAGQFTKIKISYMNKNLIKAYSFVNSPKNKNLELYIKKVKDGIVSNILFNLNTNDKILVSKKSYGLLTINNINECNNLWMFSTGTGIGPFISILDSKNYFSKIKKIILVNSIRYSYDFNYEKKLENIKNNVKNDIYIIKIVSFNKNNNYLKGKISELIKNNILENYLNFRIDNKKDYFMICGNPEMIENTKNCLKLYKNIQEKNIIFEKYWKK